MQREETENTHFTEIINDQDKLGCPESIINLIKQTVDAALEYEDVDIPCEISVTIVDNDAIKEINSDFRGIDRPTDVLSFPSGEYPPYYDDEEDASDDMQYTVDGDEELDDNGDMPCTGDDEFSGDGEMPCAGDDDYDDEDELCSQTDESRCFLGDIAISLERAEEQRIEYGHTLEREVSFLTAHSVLHLLGYDHMTPEEEKEMFEKQEMILKTIGQTR